MKSADCLSASTDEHSNSFLCFSRRYHRRAGLRWIRAFTDVSSVFERFVTEFPALAAHRSSLMCAVNQNSRARMLRFVMATRSHSFPGRGGWESPLTRDPIDIQALQRRWPARKTGRWRLSKAGCETTRGKRVRYRSTRLRIDGHKMLRGRRAGEEELCHPGHQDRASSGG